MENNTKPWVVVLCIGIAVALTVGIAVCLLKGNDTYGEDTTDPINSTNDEPTNTETPDETTVDTTPWEDKPVITAPPIEDTLPEINPPVSPDVVETGDSYIQNEDGSYTAIKDLDKYIRYDYSAIVNKNRTDKFKVKELDEMIKNPSKFAVNMIDIEVTAEMVKYYNSLPEATRNEMTFEEWMNQEYMSQEVDLGVKIPNYDMNHIREVSTGRMYRSIRDNTLVIVIAKDGFQTQNEYYQILYELFMDIVKSLSDEELAACVYSAKDFVSMGTIRTKIAEKDYDYLFNALANECIRLSYKTDTWSFCMQNNKTYGQGGHYYPTVQVEYCIVIPD